MNWRKSQPEKGTTEIRFTILKDGKIANIEVAVSSGSSVLDRISRAAIIDLRMPPLPPPYPADKLTVRIRFPYEGH
jgi:TonB family protein